MSMRKFLFGIIAIVIAGTVGMLACKNGEKVSSPEQKDSKKEAIVTDSLMVDTAYADDEDEDETCRSLNDIRFENFKGKDWVDNDYVRALRRFINEYRRGKVVADTTRIEWIDKKELRGKFVILWVEPFLGGGLFLQIAFVDHPMDVYSAWVYSYVDEGREVITGYECRLFKKEEEKSGYKTKKQLLDKMKTIPEIKLW
jgi:hypothetical protein